MTLDVENYHSIVHINYVNMSMIEYAMLDPLIKPLPIVDMSKANCDIMWNWASAWQCDCGQCAKRRPWQSMAFSLILYFNHR